MFQWAEYLPTLPMTLRSLGSLMYFECAQTCEMSHCYYEVYTMLVLFWLLVLIAIRYSNFPTWWHCAPRHTVMYEDRLQLLPRYNAVRCSLIGLVRGNTCGFMKLFMSCFNQRDMGCLLWVILCIWPRYIECSELCQGITLWWDWAFRFDKFWFRKSGHECCYACALLLWYFCCCFLCLFSLGYLFCSSFTAHRLAFSPFWSVLHAWMGAPIKTYPNLWVRLCRTLQIVLIVCSNFSKPKKYGSWVLSQQWARNYIYDPGEHKTQGT